MYSHIAVCVDGSENAMRAVSHAVELAKIGLTGASDISEASDVPEVPAVTVDLLSVIAVDVYSNMVYDPVAAHGEAQRELVSPAVAAFEEAGITPNLVLLHGRPAEEIIAFVSSHDVDLLVMGSRGLNAFQEFAIGSVSHKVLKHVSCPTLVVK